ncbi:MAG: hypothetical protein QW041_03340 [Candidatus Pacearchaeota archaeon]
MNKEISNIISDIRKIKRNFNKDLYQVAKFGYQCWVSMNKTIPTIEKLKFMKGYFKAYEDCYKSYRKRL